MTQLSNIEDHGIVPGGIEEEVKKERTNLEEDDDYDSVRGVPSVAVDYTEIDEAAEDEEEAAHRQLKEEEEGRLKERYYQEGLKYTQSMMVVCVCVFVCICVFLYVFFVWLLFVSQFQDLLRITPMMIMMMTMMMITRHH